MSAPVRTLRYRPELDGLRAVAVLLVVVHHCVQPHRFSGFVGVDIFFVLSGYLITTILVTEIGRTGSVRLATFYAKRLLRLYPALVVMLVLTTPLYRWIVGDALLQLKDVLAAATYTSNLYMTYRHVWMGPYAHTWSLALEEQYYLVWPLVLLVALRLRIPRSMLATVLLVGAVGASVLSVRDFHFGASTFPVQSTCIGLLAGSALSLAYTSWPALRRALRSSVAGVLGVVLLVLVLVLFSVTRAIPDGAYVPATVVATVLFIGYTTARDGSDRMTAVLSIRPARYLGTISYGIYLWHYPVTIVLNRAYADPAPWVRLVIVAPVTIALAAVSHRYVESPFLRLKDRLGRGGAGRTAPSVPETERSEIGS